VTTRLLTTSAHFRILLDMNKRGTFTGLLLLVLLSAGGCSLFVRPTAILWCSVPEFASYTEVYNSQQDLYKIELVYKEDPAAALASAEQQPDLIVDERLTSVKTIDLFASLEKMYKEEQLNPTVFYPQLLEQGVLEEEQVLLPVSFRLPMIIFRGGLELPGDDNLTLSYSDLKTIAEGYAVDSEELPETLSFVPSWEPAFPYYTSYLLGADYRESATGELMWNAQKINAAVSDLQRWSSDINGSQEIESLFTERHLYNPGYKLVDTGKIIFYYMNIQDYFNIPRNKRENLDFRWYGNETENPIADDILYMGLYKKGRSRAAAKNFIQWFFSTKTQQELLENSQNKRIRAFGIAQGFSSLIRINEREIPRYFPEMTGRILPAEYISVPPPLPPEWERIKNEVLIPWFSDNLVSGRAAPLEDRLQRWYLRSSDR
jgi:hypothetical protein